MIDILNDLGHTSIKTAGKNIATESGDALLS